MRLRSTAAARRAGIAFVPESRRVDAVRQEPVYKNISISILERIVRAAAASRTQERAIAQRHVEQPAASGPPRSSRSCARCRAATSRRSALAKWLTYLPKVLVLSEPTRGMDVGAKDDVVKIVRGAARPGRGVIVVSTEPETVLSLADRILVMKKGEIAREFANETVSKDRLLAAA